MPYVAFGYVAPHYAEGDEILYHVIYADGLGPPSAGQVIGGWSGVAAAAGFEPARTTTGEQVFAAPATGLAQGTEYQVSFVWHDGANSSNVDTSATWRTADEFNEGVSESITVSAGLDEALLAHAGVTEGLTPTDGMSAAIIARVSVAEGSVLADNADPDGASSALLAELLTAVDSIQARVRLSVSLQYATTPSFSPSSASGGVAALTESAFATDALSARVVVSEVVVEAGALADAAAPDGDTLSAIVEALQASDVLVDNVVVRAAFADQWAALDVYTAHASEWVDPLLPGVPEFEFPVLGLSFLYPEQTLAFEFPVR